MQQVRRKSDLAPLAGRLLGASAPRHAADEPSVFAMLNARTISGLFTAALLWVSLPSEARADSSINTTIPGPNTGENLAARIYLPDPLPPNPPAVIMMHGCSGMWEDDIEGSYATREIERWGRELAAQGYVALVPDSYGARWNTIYTYTQWKNQCGIPVQHRVNPYTTRVADIGAALDYLIDTYDVNTDGGIGLLGWSQGAESVLVAMAATPRDLDVPYASEPPYAAGVAFYPGCGPALDFDYHINGGFWRPANPMRLHMGTMDEKVDFSYCQARATTAHNVYGATPGSADELIWAPYEGVGHTFDQACDDTECDFPYTFATAKCAGAPTTANCARKDADIDSLDFFLTEVLGG